MRYRVELRCGTVRLIDEHTATVLELTPLEAHAVANRLIEAAQRIVTSPRAPTRLER
jgi:hypothetical protein